jgi:hypothetical protein
MNKSLLMLLLGFFVVNCVGTKTNTCPDLLFVKQKNEQVSKKLKTQLGRYKKNTTESFVYKRLEIPFENLTASLSNQPIFETSSLLSHAPTFIISADTTTKKKLQTELGEVQEKIRRLEAQQELGTREYENPEIKAPNEAAHKKARTMALISFWTLIAGVVIPFAFIPSIITGFIALKRYKETTNKKGRWMAITALTLYAIFAALVLATTIFVLATWNNNCCA